MACTPPSTWTISPVVAGNQSDSSATQAFAAGLGVGDVPAERGPVGPDALELLEAGDALGGHRAQRAGRDQVDPDALRAQVPGQVAGGRLQAGLGHAHPVVDGPGDGGVEVEADDRAAVRHQRQAAPGSAAFSEYVETCTAVATSVPARSRRSCRPSAASGANADRVQHAVQAVDVLADPARPARAAARRRSRPARAPARLGGSRLAIRRVSDSPRPKPVRTTVAPCSWASRATWNAIEASVSTPVTSMPLAVERFPCRQCPIPRPPSTGMTAPVM